MISRTQKKRLRLVLVFICCFIFPIGYYILNDVSTWYQVPLGATFYIILGCSLMALSGIYIVYTINRMFFTKRHKRTKGVYFKQ